MFQKIVSIILILISANSILAQNSFSTEPNVFIEEFTKYINQSKKQELVKSMELFNSNWKKGIISPEQQKFVIKITNNMMYKQLPREPYFELLITNLNLYFKEKLNPNILKQWQEISKQLLEKNQAEYLSFLNTCNLLFSEKILYKSEDKKWKVSNNNFDFGFINNKVSIIFKNVDLICEYGIDKMKILNSSGVYYPEKTIWNGNQGRVNWERVGKPENEVYCEFKSHKIDLSVSIYSIDSALLTYPKISATKIYGKLSDKISFAETKEQLLKATYPMFTSYEPTIEIKGIVGNQAIYKGGFSMAGNKINSQTIGDGMAKIILLFNNKPLVEVSSESFRLDSGQVKSRAASIRIKTDTGYIYHPKVLFNYDITKKKMIVFKGTEGLMRMPFTDNYHGVEIDVEQVIWDQKSPYIDFDMISNERAAYVETNTFFKKLLFEGWQGALSQNPLDKLYWFCKDRKTRRFTIQDYANHLGKDKKFIEQQIMDLADGGFIYYNKLNDSIYARDKMYYWQSNNTGGRDYDIIRFSSIIGARANISLNLNSHELKMEGVRKFTFSDSQNVIAAPKDQTVIINKNKGLHFAGMIRAGRIDFHSKDFNFDWNSFQIKNTTMDSMVIYYPDLNTNALKKVESVLSNTYGRILIDKPNNKSGLKNYAEYPIFIAERGSEINYDRSSTHNHAYKADKFKFEVDPFTIDSLDNFTIAGFGFEGTLVSDGIFPDIKNTARIQPDYSLGFVDKVNLPMYDGKGTGDLTINLSNRGFYGSGDLLYQTSISKSTEYLLLPDATVGVSSSFYLPESSKYPLVNGNNVKTEWYPKQDKMMQTKQDSNFKVFKTEYDFDGKLTLSPTDLKGDGRLIWPKAIYASNEMTFGRNKTKADASSIKIFAVDPNKFAFESNNVKGDVDFDKQEGKFITNQTGAYTYFPYNAYASNMNDYKWDMTLSTMEIKPNAAMAGIKPIFSGLPANQPDSLKFECAYAKFDLNKFVLNMEKIPYIDVADSRVYPFGGKAIVREKAAMDRLDSSRIEANRIDKFHDIKNCHTTILGGNMLNADGYYRYIDKYKVEQPLYADSIRIDKDKHLVGYGKINEDKNFRLDKKIGYKGLFEIISTRKPINFIGYVRPMHSFTFMETAWLRYNNVVDPQNVIINVLNPRDKNNNKLSIGLYFATDSNHVYPVFFDLKRVYSDPEIQSDTGIMFYDATKDAFMVGNENKLLNGAMKGSFIQFNEKDKSVYSEGVFNFGVNAPNTKVISAGSALHSAKDSTYRFDLTMLFNFPIPADVNAKISKFLLAEGAGKAGASLKTDEIEQAINELISDEKAAKKMINSLNSTGNIAPENEFKSGFLFTDVNLAYNRVRRKFIATGNMTMPVFNGAIINKSYNTTIAVEKKRGGDKIYIYILADNGEWMYLEYSKGNMFIATNNADLNAAVVLASEKNTDENFTLRLGSERMKENFLKRNDIEEE